MDVEAKAKELRLELEAMGAKETLMRGRINQLKQMLEEKKKRIESLASLKKQEDELLELLK